MTTTKPLCILGGGSLARECAWLVERINASAVRLEWDLIGFTDEQIKPGEPIWRQLGCLGPHAAVRDLGQETHLVCAIADAAQRFSLMKSLGLFDGVFPSAVMVDPRALVGPGAAIGDGSLIFADAIVSIDCEIGAGAVIDKQAAIGHDSRLGACCTLYPGSRVAGNCVLGERVSIGAGANVIQELTIGAEAFIGAGAAIIRDVADGCTVVGVPGRSLS